MEAECVNSTSPLNNKTEDERQVIRNELELTKMLMDKMVGNALHDTKTVCVFK